MLPNKHRLLAAVLGVSWPLLTAATGLGAEKITAAKLLNFVFVLVDDLGWADVGCYGADLHETPNIDRLASQGMRFTDAYASASVCTPTRAALMAGKYPARLHMTIWREAADRPPRNTKVIPPVAVSDLPLSEVTMARVLQSAGYLTALVGKWHLGDAAHYPEAHGFDVNIGGTIWGAPQTHFYPYRGSQLYGGEMRYVPHLEWGKPGEYLTDRLTDEAIKIVDRAKDGPFFVYLAYHAVHTPIEAPQPLVARYTEKLRPGMNHTNPTYAAMMHSVDDNMGRLLEKLQQWKIADHTVVIFTSDNGGFINQYQQMTVTSNAPLRSGKGALYEGGVRVPLIVRWPGVVAPGSICREPVVSMDLYPTLLQMANLKGDPKHNAGVDGLSLVPLLKQPQNSLHRDALFWHYPHYYNTTTPVSSVRAGPWKLLEFHEDMHVELYNLKDDLGEQKNLADELPERTGQLRQRLHAWREAVGAQMPTPNPDYRKDKRPAKPKASAGQ
jgi:arylsulfatase A-like enzyme